MNHKGISAVVAVIAISASTSIGAADPDTKPGTRMQGMQGMQGMQHGQQGMMGCPMMSGGMMGGMEGHNMMSGAMPQLPPGNEKLQLEMWGEMMQKMGEIATKYARQVKQ